PGVLAGPIYPSERRDRVLVPAAAPRPGLPALVGAAGAAGDVPQRPAQRPAVGAGVVLGTAFRAARGPDPGLRLAAVTAPWLRCGAAEPRPPAALHPARRAAASYPGHAGHGGHPHPERRCG